MDTGHRAQGTSCVEEGKEISLSRKREQSTVPQAGDKSRRMTAGTRYWTDERAVPERLSSTGTVKA